MIQHPQKIRSDFKYQNKFYIGYDSYCFDLQTDKPLVIEKNHVSQENNFDAVHFEITGYHI